MTNTNLNTLGIVLGAVLGFIVGAVAVCVTFVLYRKRVKSYDPSHDVDGRRRAIEYYSATPQGLLPSAHTRPVPVQPNIYKLSRKLEDEPSDGEEDDKERVRVTAPYDYKAMDAISEEGSEAGDEDRSPSKKALVKQYSLPAKMGQPEDLIHHSQEKFTGNTNDQPLECRLEFSLFYDTASKELHITVIRVSGIPTPDESFLRPPNCSVKMRILPEMLQWQWTRKVSRTVSPIFNETFIVPGFVHNKLRECTAHFVVLDFDHVQDNVYVIGEVFMPLSELRANRLEKITKRVNPLAF